MGEIVVVDVLLAGLVVVAAVVVVVVVVEGLLVAAVLAFVKLSLFKASVTLALSLASVDEVVVTKEEEEVTLSSASINGDSGEVVEVS